MIAEQSSQHCRENEIMRDLSKQVDINRRHMGSLIQKSQSTTNKMDRLCVRSTRPEGSKLSSIKIQSQLRASKLKWDTLTWERKRLPIPFKRADIQAPVPKSKNSRLSRFIDINQSILVTVLGVEFPG